ncbi:MAG TPA: alkaline phosphatase [Longimicrobiales bacterium]
MRCRSVPLFAVLLISACAASPLPAQEPAPPRVILFIGDGAGVAYWTAARFASEHLSVDRFTVVGLVNTRSASNKVTDSAAGATVYATGLRTYNGAIGVGPDREPRRTVLEVAEERGMATGLVATSTITHATPASFAAHVVDRRMEAEIARQYAAQQIEVLLGGGRRFFDGTGRGASDLLPDLRRRYTYVEDGAALRALDLDTVSTLLGLFADGGMPPAPERSPTLPEMTRAALEILDRDPDGFFLMVEGSQSDWRGHANEPLAAVTAEMLGLDAAIGVALDYQEDHPETLIVVVADHETGGLALEEDDSGALVAHYTTTHHTAAMIPLFARGPGAERFGGLVTNARVGELLMDAVRGAPVTVGAR